MAVDFRFPVITDAGTIHILKVMGLNLSWHIKRLQRNLSTLPSLTMYCEIRNEN